MNSYKIFLLTALAVAACGSSPAAQDPADTDDVLEISDESAAAADTTLAVTDADSSEVSDNTGTIAVPSVWSADAAKKPHAQHLTWQRDPATTMTISWAIDFTDMATYLPKAWVVPASAVTGDPEKTLPMLPAYVYSGVGKAYPTLAGDTPVEDGLHVTLSVEVTGLQAETQYFYRVGTWDSIDKAGFVKPNLSELGHFRTAAAKGKRTPLSIVLAGDSRGGLEMIQKNVERLGKIDAAMWIFNGDFTDAGFAKEWDDWIGAMQPVMRNRVLMPVQGNHELFENLFYEQFALPVEPGLPEELREHGWTVNLGNVHFVGIDSNAESTVQDELPWLEADLKAAQQDPDIDWTIVMAHHPAFSSSKHGSTDYLRKYVVPLCEKYGVDLVFSGHDHNYERTKPIRAEKVVDPADGIYYIVAGGFFSPPYDNGKNWWTEISASGSIYNYVVLNVDGKAIELKALSGDGQTLIDTLKITR